MYSRNDSIVRILAVTAAWAVLAGVAVAAAKTLLEDCGSIAPAELAKLNACAATPGLLAACVIASALRLPRSSAAVCRFAWFRLSPGR